MLCYLAIGRKGRRGYTFVDLQTQSRDALPAPPPALGCFLGAEHADSKHYNGFSSKNSFINWASSMVSQIQPSLELLPAIKKSNVSFSLFLWPCYAACGNLVPQPGIEPMSPALGAWGCNHWTIVEVPSISLFNIGSWDFPGGPVVKNQPSNAGNMGSIPGRGTKISHTSGPGCCNKDSG